MAATRRRFNNEEIGYRTRSSLPTRLLSTRFVRWVVPKEYFENSTFAL